MWSIKNRRELVRVDARDEIVAVWTEGSGMTSLTKTEEFKLVGNGCTGAFGPQWEIMAVVSVLWIWHEDYHAAKAIVGALGGG
jgi:hypothetical protein